MAFTEEEKRTWDRAIALLEKDFRLRKEHMDTVNLPGLLIAITTLRLYDDGREIDFQD